MGLRLAKQATGQVPKKSTGNLSYIHLQRDLLVNYLFRNCYIRNLVSKKRRRLLVGGYDLNMTYITDTVLAMSFPAEHMRAMYRNPMWQVKSVLDMRHSGHYKVYNLCIEQSYDPTHFHGRVERFPFDDNHVPPLQMVKDFCEDVHAWLSSDPKNIAVIHCMAGKGRTGLMVCAYLVYTGMSAEEALQVYAEKHTTNNGVLIPSQHRFVGYWEKVLSFRERVDRGLRNVNLPKPCARALRRIRLYDTVNVDSIFFVVSELQSASNFTHLKMIPGERYCPPLEVSKSCCRRNKSGCQGPHSPQYYYSFLEGNKEEDELKEEKEPRLVIQTDTESSILYQKTTLDYYYENSLQLSLREMDKVGKGRSICGPAFCMELVFGPAHLSCHALTILLKKDKNILISSCMYGL